MVCDSLLPLESYVKMSDRDSFHCPSISFLAIIFFNLGWLFSKQIKAMVALKRIIADRYFIFHERFICIYFVKHTDMYLFCCTNANRNGTTEFKLIHKKMIYAPVCVFTNCLKPLMKYWYWRRFVCEDTNEGDSCKRALAKGY